MQIAKTKLSERQLLLVTDEVCEHENANVEALSGLAQGTDCFPGRAAAWTRLSAGC